MDRRKEESRQSPGLVPGILLVQVPFPATQSYTVDDGDRATIEIARKGRSWQLARAKRWLVVAGGSGIQCALAEA